MLSGSAGAVSSGVVTSEIHATRNHIYNPKLNRGFILSVKTESRVVWFGERTQTIQQSKGQVVAMVSWESSAKNIEGLRLERSGDNERAVQAFTEAIALNPELTAAYHCNHLAFPKDDLFFREYLFAKCWEQGLHTRYGERLLKDGWEPLSARLEATFGGTSR